MRFRHFIPFVAAVLISLQPVQSAETNSSVGQLHSLWRVDGKSNVVYLLGSIHLLKAADYPLPPAIEFAFNNSKIAVFETDIGEMDSPKTQLKIMGRTTLPSGETLKDHLSENTYAAFQKQVEKAGLPTAVFDQMKPSVAGLAVVMIELQRLGADPQFGLDRYFHRAAKAADKQTIALETLDFQINLLTELSRPEGEEWIKSILDQIEDLKAFYADMVFAWKTGDSGQLEKLLNDSMREAPVLYKRFLTDRNERWVPQIEELLRSGTNAIVIVGAGHLVGTNGVVELLKQNGAKIRQL